MKSQFFQASSRRRAGVQSLALNPTAIALEPQQTQNAAERNCERPCSSQLFPAAFWVCCGSSVCLWDVRTPLSHALWIRIDSDPELMLRL
jgi:hypothetical protein